MPNSSPKKRFIVLLADGARYDVFAELLEQGQLPHLEEVFLNQGSFAKATSVFPSTTGPAYMPFLTGCFPGTCNVPGIRWFDKARYAQGGLSLKRYRSYVGFESFLMNHDMRPDLKTLFEIFPKSYTIFSSVNRGVSSEGNMSSHSRVWHWYYAHLTDRWHATDQAALDKTLKVIQKDFEFLFVVFPGIDEYSHLSYPRHPKALDAYRFIDQAVGKVQKSLKREKKWDETALFIVSDHGLSETHTHFGVASFLESKGIKTFYYPKIFKRNFQVASMVSGNGMLHLYFRTDGSWRRRASWEEIETNYPGLIQSLLEQPAVDFIASQEEQGWVHVRSRDGSVKLRDQENGIWSFENISGDPLGLKRERGEGTSESILDLTQNTAYPDSIVQLTQLFRSERTGDLVLSAAKGYDLRKRFEHPEHKSSHGALHEEHMWTPLFSSVAMRRSVVRSADLFPSLLSLSEQNVPYAIDGNSFF